MWRCGDLATCPGVRPVTYLIDGYNLMHAVGLAPAARPTGRLEPARRRFLDWLADAAAGLAVRVVFDAQSSAAASAEQEYRGLRVAFAHGRTADEMIADLAAAEPRPDRLTVVSNDHEVKDAARRRGCGVSGCEGFVDVLLAGRPPAPRTPPAGPEKPAPAATADELAAWLEAFSAPKPRRR